MNTIAYPEKHSEAEIQALLWYFLRKKKIDARLEVTAHIPYKRRSSRLDLVVFVGKDARCIVECKSWSDNYSRTAIYRTNNTKQINKYKTTYGLPVLVCARMSYVVPTVSLVEKILKI